MLEENIDMQRLVNSDMDAYLSPGTLPGNPEGTLAPFTEVNQYDDRPLDLSQGSKIQNIGPVITQHSNASTAKVGCDSCGKQFSRKEGLARYIRRNDLSVAQDVTESSKQ